MASVIFALAIMSVLAAVALNTAGDERRSSRALRESGAVLYASEAGLNEVLPACTDTLVGSMAAGDSMDFGWRTLGNGATYHAVLHKTDDGSSQDMFLLFVNGRGAGPLGGQRALSLALTRPILLPQAALTVGADLTMIGDVGMQGPCGGIHVNGSMDQTDSLTVDGEVILVGTVSGSGEIMDTSGNTVVPQTGADSANIPTLDPNDYCGEADYILRNGWIITAGPPIDSSAFSGPKILGWKYFSGGNTYQLEGEVAVPGTVCVDGNVTVTGDAGSGMAPLPLSILATGSVQFSGSPVVTADHSLGILIMAEGDVRMNGQPVVGADNYNGTIYAGAQCEFQGAPFLFGQVVCRDGPQPVGATEYNTTNRVNGSPTITFDCNSGLVASRLRPVRRRAWSQGM